MQLTQAKTQKVDAEAALRADLKSLDKKLQTRRRSHPDPDDEEAASLEAQIAEQAQAADLLAEEISAAALRLHFLDGLIETIDTYTAGLRLVPTGATRSPLATATLYEALHTGDQRITHVLLIKPQTGQAVQLINNRPLWFKYHITLESTVSVSYLCAATADSAALAAGTLTRTASGTGSIGRALTIETTSGAKTATRGGAGALPPTPPGAVGPTRRATGLRADGSGATERCSATSATAREFSDRGR